MKNFKTVICLAAFLVCLQFGTVSADSFDDLQATFISGQYTLRYENITPPSKQSTLKEKQHMWQGQKQMTSDVNDYFSYTKISGVITSDGVNRYTENFSERAQLKYSSCALTKDDEIFNFVRIEDTVKKKIQYISKDGKGKVSAIPVPVGMVSQISFGVDDGITKVLNAVLPNSQKGEGAISYKKIKTGTLSNGLEYTDLKAVNPPPGVIFDVIRYYFQGGQLVKIATGQYFGTGDNLDGRRTIIKVTEFKTTAEKNLFNLPKELKDVTQRDKKKG